MREQGSSIPTLESERLKLRGMTLDDAGRVQKLAGDRRIAETTLSIPHPYEDGMAEQWISTHEDEFGLGAGVVWAMTLRTTGELIGSIGLIVSPSHRRSELGYWVGVPYWNQGFTTEAGRLALAYAFETMNHHRVIAHHLQVNAASGRVMRKLGMTHEGTLRQHIMKWGRFHNLEYYGILREEFAQVNG